MSESRVTCRTHTSVEICLAREEETSTASNNSQQLHISERRESLKAFQRASQQRRDSRAQHSWLLTQSAPADA